MARSKKKSVLNQNVDKEQIKNTEEIKEEKIEEGIFDNREPDLSQLEAAMKKESTISSEENIDITTEVLEVEDPEMEEKEDEIVVEEQSKKKTLADLTGEELRFYQRTGIIR